MYGKKRNRKISNKLLKKKLMSFFLFSQYQKHNVKDKVKKEFINKNKKEFNIFKNIKTELNNKDRINLNLEVNNNFVFEQDKIKLFKEEDFNKENNKNSNY
jgi:hypothetical protein